MQFIDALRILSAFECHGVAYVLVGSMAMAAQGIVRATRDIAFFVSADEPNVARLKTALREIFDDPEIDRISAADLAGGSARPLDSGTWSSKSYRSKAWRSVSPRHGCCTG